MEKESKHIAIMSIEEWGKFVNQLLENHCEMMAHIVISVSDPKVASILTDTAALVFGKTTGAISKKLFPDAEYYENEKGEMKWR